jgi:hypothetical protein
VLLSEMPMLDDIDRAVPPLLRSGSTTLGGYGMLSSSDTSFLSFSTCILLDWDSPLSSVSTSGGTPTPRGSIVSRVPSTGGPQDATKDRGP